MPDPVIVFALYKPHPGKEAEMLKLVERHGPALHRFGLATDRTPVICRSANGTIIEVFEWVDGAAHSRVRQHPELAAIWQEMSKIGTLPTLGSLPEAVETFPHFEPVTF